MTQAATPPIRRRTMPAGNGTASGPAASSVPSAQFVPEGVDRKPMTASEPESGIPVVEQQTVPTGVLAPEGQSVREQAGGEIQRLDAQGAPEAASRKGNRFGPRGLSQEMRAEIVTLVKGGMSVMDVSKKLSITYLTVKKYAAAAGVVAAPVKRGRPAKAKASSTKAKPKAKPKTRTAKAAPAAAAPKAVKSTPVYSGQAKLVAQMLRDKKFDAATALALVTDPVDLISALV